MNEKTSACGYNKKDGVIGSIKKNLESGCEGEALSSSSILSAISINLLPFIPNSVKKIYLTIKLLMPASISLKDWFNGEGPVKLATKFTSNEDIKEIVSDEAPKIAQFIDTKIVPVAVTTNVIEEYFFKEVAPSIMSVADASYNFYNETMSHYSACINNNGTALKCTVSEFAPIVTKTAHLTANLLGRISNYFTPDDSEDL